MTEFARARAASRQLTVSEAVRLSRDPQTDWYYLLFEAATDAHVVTDAGGRIQEANRSAEELFGMGRRFLLGKPLAVYLRGSGRAYHAAVADARTSGHVGGRSLTLKRRSGETIPLEAAIGHVSSPLGEGLLWVLRNVTREREAEESLERAVRERTRELEATTKAKDELLRELERRSTAEREFVANAAHELRTPLAAMVSALEVLSGGAKDVPEERDRFLGHLADHCARLHRLTYTLLVLARAQMSQEPVPTEPVALRPLLEDVAQSVAPRRLVAVSVRCAAGLMVRADAELLEHAIGNVVANSAKYVHEGQIRLSARKGRNRTVRIAIADTGPGLRAEHVDRAFERFFRGDAGEKSDGFGLGLSIARQAVEALQGTIEIESELGVGTTVVMRLPGAEQ